jgi:uncharacterized membrane protein YeaQ/YmgE (transglycosylase-associated protein family)
MRENPPPGLLSSLFAPIFVGAICGWFLPYFFLKSPVTGDRFVDGVIGLVICGIFGGVVGALLKRRRT